MTAPTDEEIELAQRLLQLERYKAEIYGLIEREDVTQVPAYLKRLLELCCIDTDTDILWELRKCRVFDDTFTYDSAADRLFSLINDDEELQAIIKPEYRLELLMGIGVVIEAITEEVHSQFTWGGIKGEYGVSLAGSHGPGVYHYNDDGSMVLVFKLTPDDTR